SKLIFLAVLLSVLLHSAWAQDKANVKFGDVSEKHFVNKIYPIDSNASAVVIADIGSSRIEGNNKGGFSLVYKHFKRVHILNKNGYDIANVSISLYSDGDDEEELDKLRAVTYNLENGKVAETKLDVKSNVFKDKISKNLVVRKFTFPNVKEGSIIEYEYSITSDYLTNLQPWEFQGAYPRLWSEYNLSLPAFFGYVFITQGSKNYDINQTEQRRESFQVLDTRGVGASERFSFQAEVTDNRWVMKNVPALKEESYTSTIDNHIAKIEFQLSELRPPAYVYRKIMGTWNQLTENLMKSEYFGEQISKDNSWLKDIVSPVVNASDSKEAKAKKIFAYVRDNFTCTSHDRRSMDQSLKNLTKTKNGNVAEMNLLLTAMLKYLDIEADPVILSTRSHGYTFPLYPILSKFNYTICRAIIDGKTYFLDASDPHIGFGRLPVRCYNGHARVVNKAADAIGLSSDQVTETKTTSIFLINDNKGNLIGSLQQTPGYYESLNLRDRIKEKGEEQLQKDIKKAFGADIVISNFGVDSLNKYDYELGIHYDFDIKDEKEDIMY
ncbi:MAG: transglutaminase domain-containing protein, partial [Bacteroidota bacterium]